MARILINKKQYVKLVNEGLIDVLKQAVVQASKNPEVKKLVKQAMTNALKKGAAELEKFTRNPEDYIEALSKSPVERPSRTRKKPPTQETEVEVEVEVDESPEITAKKEEIKKNEDILVELKGKKKKTAHDRNIIPMIEINLTKLKRELRELEGKK
jgi:hypothetical protein|tara:strand:- start:582 stop:1049 length:468 start_codon:yes stop_codon:yes gene_type:complete